MTARGIRITVCVLAALLTACGPIEDGKEAPPDIDAMLAEGRALLAEGDSCGAGRIFHDVLALDPGNAQARYGIVLADALDLLHLADDLVRFLQESMAGGAADPEDVDLSPAGGIGDTIDQYVGGIFTPVAGEMLLQAGLLYPDREVVFDLAGLPLRFGNQDINDLAGRWDHTEAVLLLAVSNLLSGVLDLLLALDLNFDLGLVFDLPIDWNDLDSVDLGRIWRDLVHLAVLLLSDPDYPNFLGPDASAAERMPRAAVELGLACKYLVEFVQELRAETGDHAGDVFHYDDLNGNGAWDPGEPLHLPFLGQVGPDREPLLFAIGLLLSGLQASLLDGSPIDPLPDQSTPFDLALLNPLIQALLGWDFGPIPSVMIDLGGAFLDPYPVYAEFKARALALLLCIDENPDLLSALRCVVEELKEPSPPASLPWRGEG